MLRRLLLFTALLQFAAPVVSTLLGQEAQELRILERQVRLTLDDSGEYRVIDAMRVRLAAGQSGSLATPLPLPLIVLQEEAEGARGLGGDVSPTQVARDGNELVIVGAIPSPTFEVGVTYRLPRDVEALALSSAAPVDELAVFVDRGRISVRAEGGLVREGDLGTASQTSLNYVARDLAAGTTLRLTIVSRRTGWRERLGVLIATLLATGAAGIWAWSRAA